MIGLCIGTGEWLRVAQRAAARMEKMTGIPCRVVDRVDANLQHSSWHKLNLLRDYPDEELFIFDADIWCARPWWPRAYLETGLAMVPELPTYAVRLECALYHIPIDRYFNGGVIIADQRAAEIFAATKKLHPTYGLWLEQTGLSHTIAAQGFPVQEMPVACNCLLDPAQTIAQIAATPATNMHFAGRKTVARLHEIFDALEAHPSFVSPTTKTQEIQP
jgi:hypothetical protein